MRWQQLLSILVFAGACSAPASDEATEESTEGLSKLPSSPSAFTTFETLQVRPLALSPNGRYLFAANTPDNRLEIYRVGGGALQPVASVAVGLEPVAVAARSNDEVWVVNHLSDSVSIVKVDNGFNSRVVRTLLVGDEPRDIVFAGRGRDRAFITTAHRGQNTGDAYDLQSPNVSRADVWVFDADDLGAAAGGERLTKISLFADTPRALAASADGRTVYAAAFFSGNETTSVSPEAVQKVYGGVPPTNIGFPQPPVGLIVKFKGGHWVDANGKVFDAYVRIRLPDKDVFAIDAMANPPVAKAEYTHVGTTLFNMAVNPRSGKVYVTNTEARNDVRFEGHRPGFTSVRGHITDSRISVIDPGAASVTPRYLNTHINYDLDGNPAEKALTVAFPQDLAVSRDGSTLYTVAQGSSKLAIYSTAAIEAGNPSPSLRDQVVLSGGGPAGLALDEDNRHAYVLTRFDNSIAVVDVRRRKEVRKVKMFNPEPASVVDGRKFLYDANLTSQHGDTACSSCHIGGDNDGLAWDLGNPGGLPLPMIDQVNAFTIAPLAIITLLPAFKDVFRFNHPLKGPMTTQSLRGMDNHGSMHWRGDRNGSVNQDGSDVIDPATGLRVVSAQPNAGIFDELRAFTSFNVAFPGLLGRATMLTDAEMRAFADFILQVMYPPNPIRSLDNALTPDQQAGRDFYFAHNPATGQELPSDRFHNCNGCHTLDTQGNAGQSARPGFFGSDGRLSFEFESQIFKVPHLRNLYTKVGMVGSSPDVLQPGTLFLPEQQQLNNATRGFGFNHDGVLGQLEHFFTGQVFLKATANLVLPDGTVIPPNPFGIPYIDLQKLLASPPQVALVEDGGFKLRRDIVAFMMAFDSNLAPIVGQQVTLTRANQASAHDRVTLFVERAEAGECDLVARGGTPFGPEVGFLYVDGAFKSDLSSAPPLSGAQLRGLATAGRMALTFTCAPPGSGQRMALDRDGDGWADADERRFHRNPADPGSHP